MKVWVDAPEHLTLFSNIFKPSYILNGKKWWKNDAKWRQTRSGASGTHWYWYMHVQVNAPEHLTSFLNIFKTF
jgi:hypothetical protein